MEFDNHELKRFVLFGIVAGVGFAAWRGVPHAWGPDLERWAFGDSIVAHAIVGAMVGAFIAWLKYKASQRR
jgi:hypothetical protein